MVVGQEFVTDGHDDVLQHGGQLCQRVVDDPRHADRAKDLLPPKEVLAVDAEVVADEPEILLVERRQVDRYREVTGQRILVVPIVQQWQGG